MNGADTARAEPCALLSASPESRHSISRSGFASIGLEVKLPDVEQSLPRHLPFYIAGE